MVLFVGRQPELAVLRARLADAVAGQPQVVHIQGPPGIGKTALIEHFLREPGVTPAPVVLRASGEETEELLTYGVIDQLARSAATAGAGLSGVVRGVGPQPVEDPVTVGTRLLELLDRIDVAPVVLVVDDVHWADLPSLQALIFALRRLVADPVLALLAMREDAVAGQPGSLRRLVSGHRGSELRLRGLDEQDLRDLAAEMGITGFELTAAQRLRYGTQGNPLHARALLDEFPPAHWGPRQQPLPSPRSFRLLVEDRYAGCTEATRALVDAAAVLGPHCPLPLAAALAGIGEPLLAVDEAQRRDLLVPDEARSPWTLSFPHPLVRAAVYDALGPARRHDLHLQAAALLVATSAPRFRKATFMPSAGRKVAFLNGPGGPSGGAPGEAQAGVPRVARVGARDGAPAGALGGVPDSVQSAVLRHRVAAAAEPDDGLAADLTRFADREARRQAWQSAATHLLDAARLSPDPREAQLRVLQAVVWTLLRGDAATAATFTDRVASFPPGALRDATLGALATAADDPAAAERLLATAAERLGGGAAERLGGGAAESLGGGAAERSGDAAAERLLATAAVRSGDTARAAAGERTRTSVPAAAERDAAATVALMTAIHHYGRLNAAGLVAWCRRTLDLTDPATSMHAVAQTYLLHGLGYGGHTADAAAAASAADDRPGVPDHLWLNPRSARGLLRLVDDDVDGAVADLTSVATAASRLGILNTSAFALAYLARAEWVAGDWDSAVVHAERAVAVNLEADFGFMQSAVVGIAALVPTARGDWATAEGHLRTLADRGVRYERSTVALAMARARLGEARGDAAAVLAALEPVRAFEHRDAADEPGFWQWPDLYSDALVGTGRAEEAAAFLVPHEERARDRGRRSAIARIARARGRAEAALGRPAEAERAFGLAWDAVEGVAAPFERARVELAMGAFLRRAGRRRRAADLLGAAELAFSTLGAAPYAERCAKELAASGLHPAERRGPTGTGLTAQELVVARLAAGGRSNREVADELVVSIKTIEYHLRNAFHKLGVTSRRQLAARLAES